MHTSNSSQLQEEKGKEDVDSTNRKKKVHDVTSKKKKKRPEGNSGNTKHLKMTEVPLSALTNIQHDWFSWHPP